MTLKHNPTRGKRNANKSHIRDLQKGKTGTYIADKSVKCLIRFYPHNNPQEVGIIISIFEIRKPRHRKVK